MPKITHRVTEREKVLFSEKKKERKKTGVVDTEEERAHCRRG